MRKVRCDKKYTLQTRLTEEEMIVLNHFKLKMKFHTTLETVNYCLRIGLEDGFDTYIDREEKDNVKARKVSDDDTILVNGRVLGEAKFLFKYIQAEFNLNQRQLLYILIARIIERNGMDFREGSE